MYHYHLGISLVNAGACDDAEGRLDRLRAVAAATGSTRVRAYTSRSCPPSREADADHVCHQQAARGLR